MTPQNETYNTLEEIQLRRDQLSEAIENDSELIAEKWHELFDKKEDSTKGEYIATIIGNTVTAIDAFILVRKLMKNYSGIFSFFKSKKKKNRK